MPITEHDPVDIVAGLQRVEVEVRNLCIGLNDASVTERIPVETRDKVSALQHMMEPEAIEARREAVVRFESNPTQEHLNAVVDIYREAHSDINAVIMDMRYSSDLPHEEPHIFGRIDRSYDVLTSEYYNTPRSLESFHSEPLTMVDVIRQGMQAGMMAVEGQGQNTLAKRQDAPPGLTPMGEHLWWEENTTIQIDEVPEQISAIGAQLRVTFSTDQLNGLPVVDVESAELQVGVGGATDPIIGPTVGLTPTRAR